MMIRNNLFLLFALLIFGSCSGNHKYIEESAEAIKTITKAKMENTVSDTSSSTQGDEQKTTKLEIAVLGGGCFWCTEAQYLALDGVESVVSGYAGGNVKNPTYKEVCTGTTGHAEVIKITFDPAKISYIEILQAFFVAHDPTQLNRQGNDIGTQYRSTIMPVNDEQKSIAEDLIKEFNEKEVYNGPVVTTIEPLDVFYPAEDYHQNYYAQNKETNPYCTMVVGPKLEKFKKLFKDKLKTK